MSLKNCFAGEIPESSLLFCFSQRNSAWLGRVKGRSAQHKAHLTRRWHVHSTAPGVDIWANLGVGSWTDMFTAQSRTDQPGQKRA